MGNAIPPLLRGSLAIILHFLNSAFWCPLIYLLALIRLLLPVAAWRAGCARGAIRLAEGWIRGTVDLTTLLGRIDWDLQGLEGLRRDRWYLVVANHQSWVDLIVLLKVVDRRLPFPKVFAKRQMLWLPLIGLALLALDFPIMRRYSKAQLERHPELRGRDLEVTRRACRACRVTPVLIVNFLEGTRCTPAKQARQESPFRHLLRPKAGGVAFALNGMEGTLTTALDLTLAYPAGIPTFWDYLCGRVGPVKVRLQQRPIPTAVQQGDYLSDPVYRAAVQSWVDDLWREKDALLDTLLPDLP